MPEGENIVDVAGITLSALANWVGQKYQRPGIDSTGSKDLFDVHLTYAPVELGVSAAPPGETATGPAGLASSQGIVGGAAKQALNTPAFRPAHRAC